MEKNGKKRIIIVDDHPMMKKGMALTLDTELNFEVVKEFDRAEEALQKFEALSPDLMTVDISLPGMSGLELIKQLLARDPKLKILVVSRHDESLYAERVLRAGAKGYLMKMEAGDKLITAAKKVLSGRIYVSDNINEKLLLGMTQGQKTVTGSPLEELSDRELEVFEFTGRGHTTREIAERLHLSVKTIESYRARIKTKLNLDNANELMMHAVKWEAGDGERRED